MDYRNHRPDRCQLPDWPIIRDMVLDRDGHKCVFCGSTENLNVHHMTYKNEMTSEQAEANDCITVCHEHHERLHSVLQAGIEKSFSKYFPNRSQERKMTFNNVPVKDILMTLRYLDAMTARKAIDEFGDFPVWKNKWIIVRYATNCIDECYKSTDFRRVSGITGLRDTYKQQVDESSGYVLFQMISRKQHPKRPDVFIRWW